MEGVHNNIENATAVTTEDLAIHAAGYSGVYEADGGGGHVYRRFTLAPRNGMIIAANADGIHSSKCDEGPTIENSVVKSLLDDFFNIQTTMQLVMAVSSMGGSDGAAATAASPSSGTGTHTLTVVHPHVSDQPVTGHTEQWYGTSEPFSRVRKGDALILYDPATFKELGTVTATDAAVLLSPSSDVTRCSRPRTQQLHICGLGRVLARKTVALGLIPPHYCSRVHPPSPTPSIQPNRKAGRRSLPELLSKVLVLPARAVRAPALAVVGLRSCGQRPTPCGRGQPHRGQGALRAADRTDGPGRHGAPKFRF